MNIGCVVLTTGTRPDVLALALESLERQRGVELDTVVVFNGAQPPPGVRGIGLAEDIGIPAARNAGTEHVRGELLFFLDDDASLVDGDALARVAAQFDADPALGALQLGVAPRGGGAYSRDWVPRLRVGDRTRPSDVAALWEGAVAVRRSAFDLVGGWPGEFRFVHEGVDLAWRILDAGFRVHYAGDIGALHPPPARVAAGDTDPRGTDVDSQPDPGPALSMLRGAGLGAAKRRGRHGLTIGHRPRSRAEQRYELRQMPGQRPGLRPVQAARRRPGRCRPGRRRGRRGPARRAAPAPRP